MAGSVQGGRWGCLRSEIWLPLALLLAGAATGGVAGRGSWDPQGEEQKVNGEKNYGGQRQVDSLPKLPKVMKYNNM